MGTFDTRMGRLEADQQLNTACQAITASVAMLRATELHVHEIQDRQGYSPDEATLLCEQMVALRDLLKLRLDDSGAKLNGPISRGPSPSRVTAGSRVAFVVEEQHQQHRSVPPMRASTVSSAGLTPHKLVRRGSTTHHTTGHLIPQLSREASAAQDEAEVEVLPLLETISAVLRERFQL